MGQNTPNYQNDISLLYRHLWFAWNILYFSLCSVKSNARLLSENRKTESIKNHCYHFFLVLLNVLILQIYYIL